MVSLTHSPAGYACWAVSFLLQENTMETITLFGLDIGKNSLHLVGQMLTANPSSNVTSLAARRILSAQYEHYRYLAELIAGLNSQIGAQAKADALTSRLMTIPGIVPITASQLAADADNAQSYGSARHFAASLGLVPRQHSTGGKSKLLGISKRGDKSLRRLLVQCARVVMQNAAKWQSAVAQWTQQLMTRRHSNVVACALANKLARIVWAVLVKGEEYRPNPNAA
ncbi:IS110 family transposase [Aeromonas salmonicida]|uniref:IS110 family transposase n=2 Tax=Aeromonas salmonicida TaxID=645 RepID=UPI00307C3848